MITVHPSRRLLALMLVQLVLAFFSLYVLISLQAHFVRLLWSFAFIMAIYCAVHLWSRQQVICLRVSSGECFVFTADCGQHSEQKPIRLLSMSDRIEWDFLLVFRALGEDGVERRFLILRDSVSPAEFRRLRVFLRWQGRRCARKTLA